MERNAPRNRVTIGILLGRFIQRRKSHDGRPVSTRTHRISGPSVNGQFAFLNDGELEIRPDKFRL